MTLYKVTSYVYMANFNNKSFICGYLFVLIKILIFTRKLVEFVDLSSNLSRQKKKLNIMSCSSLNCPPFSNWTPPGATLTQFTPSVHISLTFTLILHSSLGLNIVRFSQVFLYYPLQYISYLFTFSQMPTYFCVHRSSFHCPSWYIK